MIIYSMNKRKNWWGDIVNFSKKINLKLVLIGIVFMGLLRLTNGVLMKYALEKSAESTYNTHYKEAEKILNQEIYILKDR